MSQYKPNNQAIERERIVFECIKNNPNLHHNAILKLVVPEFMAKSTFEKTRDSLLSKEIITVNSIGNMKYYVTTKNFDDKSQHFIERNTNESFHDLKLKIKRLDTDYHHKDIDEKINHATLLIKDLLQVDNGFTLLDSIKNPKKTLYRDEHQMIQESIHHIFSVVKQDKDFEIIYPAVISYLSQITPQGFIEK